MSQIFLIVTIDTEEDQWGPSEEPVSVSNTFALPKLQSLLDDYGIVPTYLVNYPVVADGGGLTESWLRFLIEGDAKSGLISIHGTPPHSANREPTGIQC